MNQAVQWLNPPQNKDRKEIINQLKENQNLPDLTDTTLNILVNRGMDTPEKIMKILDKDIMNQHNPMLLKDSDTFVQHLQKAIESGKHIVIYGDYDSDGASATAIAMLSLRQLGAKVDYWINNRFKHGYGITPEGVKDLVNKYPTVEVIITVDNGIVAFDGIQEAMSRGIQVLVTDHHEPSPDGKLPPADAVVNPKRLDDTYPFKGICGATVIYKLMMLLYLKMKEPLDYVYSMVDIVGMATVGDVMPLLDENRLFVKESIKSINKNPRYAFKSLKEAIGQSTIDEGTFGFQFVPMINSIGRLTGEIDQAVELFLSTDKDEVDKIVSYLTSMNEKRKEMTTKQEELAISMVKDKGVQPVIVLAHEDFHEGIVGLVAGRIKEKYHRPTIVFTKTDEGLWKGSGRSIEKFSLIDSLYKVAEHTQGFGGHDMACGVGLKQEQLEDFERAMIEIANKTLEPEDFIPKIQVDVFVSPQEVTEQLVEELEELKPFGTSFEAPNIAVKGFKVKKSFTMGKTREHLKLMNDDLTLIMWNGRDYYHQNLQEAENVQAIGMPSLNYWGGKTSIQMIVKDDNLRAM